MSDPSSPVLVASWVAWFSAVVLALLGVDYYALLGAFGGVLFAVSAGKDEPESKLRLALTVALTTYVAAVLGQAVIEWAGIQNRKMLLAFCLVVGGLGQAGLQKLLDVAGGAIADFIKRRGAQ